MLGATTMALAESKRQKLALFRRSSAAPEEVFRLLKLQRWWKSLENRRKTKENPCFSIGKPIDFHAIYRVSELFEAFEHLFSGRVAHGQLGQREGAEAGNGVHPHGGIVEQGSERQGPRDLDRSRLKGN